MKKLLPNKKQFKIILVFLLLQYAFLGFLNAKNIPNLASQSFVWLIYIILFILLNKSLKKSKEEISNGRKTQLNLSWKNLTLLSLVFLTSSVIFSIIFAPFKSALWILLLFIYITIGLKLTIYSIKKILSK